MPLALLYPTMHYRYTIASDLLCSSEHSLFSACLFDLFFLCLNLFVLIHFLDSHIALQSCFSVLSIFLDYFDCAQLCM